jgi:hypothetical protein
MHATHDGQNGEEGAATITAASMKVRMKGIINLCAQLTITVE